MTTWRLPRRGWPGYAPRPRPARSTISARATACGSFTVFGSAARDDPSARDLDVAVMTERGRDLDALALLDDLVDLTGVDAVDLAHLNHGGPVIRERALVGCVALFESVEGAYAAAQTASIGQRIETDAMRRLDLELLAE